MKQQLNALLELKALGFSSDEIKLIIDGRTEEERTWLLVKMVCIEDIRTQKSLSEALWL